MEDFLVFVDDEVSTNANKWKILIVDDDADVHAVTKVALQNKRFHDKGIEIISAMSAQEAKEILAVHDDFAMAIIDVMMETPDAGLKLINYIRNDLENSIIRLILRTGQPDQVPENEIIELYDINDYKEKTELTAQKLYTLTRFSIKQFEQLKRLQQQEKLLLIQTRNSQMGEMLNMIAHQWRQPLSTISSIVNNVQIKIAMKDYNEDFLLEQSKLVDNLLQHLSKTISDFRRFYAPDKEKTSFLVQRIIDKSLEIIQPSLELSNFKINVNNTSSMEVFSFENELQQVLLNILKNAQDSFELKNQEDPQVDINAFDKDNKVYIQISDNAGGIEPSVIEKIFDPYFTTKEKTNGTGLGLYMSKLIIEDHCKGSLTARNSDKGAVFQIELEHKNAATV